MSHEVLSLQQVGKSYRDYPAQRHRFLSWFGLEQKAYRDNWVLRDISFSVRAGEAVGIVGVNGAGKSTLLRIIAGTLAPTTGTVTVHGKISAILELGMGFNQDLSARANILHACGLMGYGQQEILAMMDEIESFVEVGDYFDQPLRTFSSGMQMRVAFAAATAFRSEILIVDEALSVGDAYFQHKSAARIRQFKEQGTTLLFVSHDPGAVRALCQRALLIENGMIHRDDDATSVIDYYCAAQVQRCDATGVTDMMLQESDRSNNSEIDHKVVLVRKSVGNVQADVMGPTTPIRSGDPLTVRVKATFQEACSDPHIGFGIRTRLGIVVYEANSYTLGCRTRAVSCGETLVIDFIFPGILHPGTYELMVGIADGGYGTGSFERAFFFDQSFLIFEVTPSQDGGWQGVCNLRPEVRVHEK